MGCNCGKNRVRRSPVVQPPQEQAPASLAAAAAAPVTEELPAVPDSAVPAPSV